MPESDPQREPADNFGKPSPGVGDDASTLLPQAIGHLYEDHPALLITLGYLFLTAVGMSYEYLFFEQFGLNIFDYADASDFVLEALRKPRLLLLTLISVAIIRNIYRAHNSSMRKSTRYRAWSNWMMSWGQYRTLERILVAFTLVMYFGFFSELYAHYNADQIKFGHGPAVFVELISDGPTGTTNRVPTRCLSLGATSRYLIVFNPTNGHTAILPLGNVGRITLDVAYPQRVRKHLP